MSESEWIVVSNVFDCENEVSAYDPCVKLHQSKRVNGKISYPNSMLKDIDDIF